MTRQQYLLLLEMVPVVPLVFIAFPKSFGERMRAPTEQSGLVADPTFSG